ncbi:MAG: 50S ribosomal protein L18 [Mycoplasmataceae bacterium]|nr:50S ribosomal protein L18 [Mycoplasmataceae bacterium]
MAHKTKNEKRKFKHQRIRKDIIGTPSRPRLNIYKSNTGIYAQLIDDVNGKTIASVSSLTLKLSPNNIENASKVGIELGKLANKIQVTEIVFDRGGYIYHGKVKALADGVRQEGIKF